MTVPSFVPNLRAADWIIIRCRGHWQLAQVLPTSNAVRGRGGLKVWKFMEEPGKPSRFTDPIRIPFIDVLRRPTSQLELEAVLRAERFQEREGLDPAKQRSSRLSAKITDPLAVGVSHAEKLLTLLFVAIGRAGMAVLS